MPSSEPSPRPPALLSSIAALAVVLLWGALRLWIFGDRSFPLTFVLPLMLCVWTRRAWQLWAMAGIFAVMTVLKFWWILPDGHEDRDVMTMSVTLANIVFGAGAVYGIMRLRDKVDERNGEIRRQNVELEARMEELFQQNEEIRAQSEELARQSGEIEAQAEELAQQNEDLQHANQLLASREEVLQAVAQHARTPKENAMVLEEVCRRALTALGEPAEGLALLTFSPGGETLLAAARVSAREDGPPLPEEWPLERSLAALVLEEDRTAYVDDLRQRRDLASPFIPDAAAGDAPAEQWTCRSLLATPVHIVGARAGVLAVCSSRAAHWTQDQFQLAEWAAAQCGLLLENRRWQEELQRHAEELEAASRAKDAFMATLSHELRTPLTPVLVTAEALERDVRLPDDVREDLRVIRRNVAVQSRLIDDLLDLTRITRGKVDLHLQHLSLISLLQESASIVAPELDAAEIGLVLDLNLPPHCAVTGDGARLQQVFWNLLKNAIKFSPRKSRVTLRASLDHDPADPVPPSGVRAVISVTDEGRGIAPEDMERIFRPFEQVGAGSPGRRGSDGGSGGLGLGLSIARAILELHDGSISVSSEGLGRGATFTVRLPVATRPWTEAAPVAGEAPPEETPSPAAGGQSRTLSILLVEDHADTGRVIARLLSNCGYDVARAESCQQALDLWRSRKFDLIISDLGLPDGSGLDLMRAIRREDARIPGICTSGYGMENDIALSREAGFCEHLIKPVDMRHLRAVIRRLAGAPPPAENPSRSLLAVQTSPASPFSRNEAGALRGGVN